MSLPQISSVAADLQKPMLACPKLPAFDGGSLREVQVAFASAPAIALRQAWMEETDPGFCPGHIRVGWRDNTLLVFAELIGKEISTRATAANQRLWELGDTFEIFLHAPAHPGYVEIQLAPNNHSLHLQFPHAKAVEDLRANGIEKYLQEDKGFHCQSWAAARADRWTIYAEIPATILGVSAPTLQGQEWGFSFCRYHHNAGKKAPVISSTSPHCQPDFHRPGEWGVLRFETAI